MESNVSAARAERMIKKSFTSVHLSLRQALDSVSKGQRKLDLAQRLTGALSSENDRWAEHVIQLRADMELLAGDVLLAASFIRYEYRIVSYRIVSYRIVSNAGGS